MFKRLFTTAVIFGAAALAPPLPAQPLPCLPRDALIERLTGQFNEHLTGGGLQGPRQFIEIWSSDLTGSFTIIVTRPDGMSCVLAVGENWISVPALPHEGVAG